MRRDLERRIGAVERRRYGSERVATYLRAIDADNREQLEQLFDPCSLAALSHAELDQLIAELAARGGCDPHHIGTLTDTPTADDYEATLPTVSGNVPSLA